MSNPVTSHQSSPTTRGSRTCKYCFKTFSKAEHLLRHERSHTKERPFQCKDCGKSYSRNDTLLRHFKVHAKSKGDQEAISEYDETSSPDRVSDPSASSGPIQASLVQRQGYYERDVSSGHSQLPSNANNTATTSPMDQIDSQLQGHRQSFQGIPREQSEFLQNGVLNPSIQQPLAETQSGGFTLSPHGEIWNTAPDSSYPSWLIGDDFDIEAFNMALLAPMFVDQSGWQTAMPEMNSNIAATSRVRTQSQSVTSMDVIQGLWITKTDSNVRTDNGNSYSVAPTRPMTPSMVSPGGTAVDDRYREDLSLKLRPRWKEDPLPSTGFLNLALQLFFTKFNPIFPILHGPTFRPSNHNSLLLLSICSIGSLFMGSSAATAQGCKIFERLNKVILASWENILTRNSPERISLIQAAVIGQTFGYLSGNPKYLATVEAFHGTVIVWARRCGMFTITPVLPSLNVKTSEELDEAWHSWADAEQIARTAFGLYIHDAQFASMFHHDPTLRHNAIKLQPAFGNEIFSAPTAAHWAALIKSSTSSPKTLQNHIHLNQPQHDPSQPLPYELQCVSSQFSCYVLLHGIEAAIQEANQAGPINPTDVEKYRDALICWYHSYRRPKQQSDPFCLMILWHQIFMSLYVNFDELERAIGRDGGNNAADAVRYVEYWASSNEAKRCVVHASLIHREIGNMRMDSEPAIHVPRCMFLAAVAWYCYIEFGVSPSESTTPLEFLDFPEITLLNVNPSQHLFEASGFKKGKPALNEASPLCGLSDMLLRIGHWEIAKRFANIVGFLIHGNTESHYIEIS